MTISPGCISSREWDSCHHCSLARPPRKLNSSLSGEPFPLITVLFDKSEISCYPLLFLVPKTGAGKDTHVPRDYSSSPLPTTH